MSSGPLRRTRYETVGEHETLSVELPNGVGVVHIRTDDGTTMHGHPIITVELVSDTLDTPAADGRYYLPGISRRPNTMVLTGLPEDTWSDFGPADANEQ